jgi:response regulator RpfG family c-di-GMP phosphodiesterase
LSTIVESLYEKKPYSSIKLKIKLKINLMEQKKINVLYVDDEAHNLTSFKANLRQYYNVYTAPSAEEAAPILKNNTIHIVITDQRMPNITGVEFLESVIKEYPNAIRILLTGYADMEAIIDAINKGQIYRYIMKPFNIDELKMSIDNAYEVYRLREENKQLLKNLVKVNDQLEFMLRQKLVAIDNDPNVPQ